MADKKNNEKAGSSTSGGVGDAPSSPVVMRSLSSGKVSIEGDDDDLPEPPRPRMMGRRGSILRRDEGGVRGDRMKTLFLKEHIRSRMFRSMADISRELVSEDEEAMGALADPEMMRELEKEVEQEEETEDSSTLKQITSKLKEIGIDHQSSGWDRQIREKPLEVRVQGFSFTATVDELSTEIKTVYNDSLLYPIAQFFKAIRHGKNPFAPKVKLEKKVLSDINLVLKPGRSYLVLGAPGSGKTTLLKAVAGLLRPGPNDTIEGTISYNGRTLEVSCGCDRSYLFLHLFV